MHFNFKLGTKIVFVITATLLVCMSILAFIVVANVNKEQTAVTEKLLSAIADEISGIIDHNINSAHISLASVQETIEEILRDDNIKLQEMRLETQVKNLLDSNVSGTYGYIYIKDANYFGDNNVNPRNRLENGEFMILARDNNPETVGGIQLLNADMSIINFGSVKKALSTGRESIGNPRFVNVAKEGDKMGFAINIPLRKDGKVIGVAGIYIDSAPIAKILLSSQFSTFEGDYRAVLSSDGMVIIHPQENLLGKLFKDLNTHPTAITLQNAISSNQNGVYEYLNYKGQNMMAQLKAFEVGVDTGVFWSILVMAPKDSVYKTLYNLRMIIIASICVSLFVVILAVYIYVKFNISQRVENISNHLFAFFRYLLLTFR